MPRKPNQLKTASIPISTTEAIKGYLEQLVATGLYGKNSTEAAERLLARSLEEMVEKGKLKRRSK